MHNTFSTSSSSSSSNFQRTAVTIQTTPPTPPPNHWEAIAIEIFRSSESFSEFKRSPLAGEFIALGLRPEAFNDQLIGRQLVAGIVDRQGLCRAAWAFQKLRISDDEVKASLEAKALEILQDPDLSPDQQALILDTIAQFGKIGVRDSRLLTVLTKEVNQLFNTMEPPVDLSRNFRALKSLNSLGNGSSQAKAAMLGTIQQRIAAVYADVYNEKLQDHQLPPEQMVQALAVFSNHTDILRQSGDQVSFEEIIHLIAGLSFEREYASAIVIQAKGWVTLLRTCAQRVLDEPSLDSIPPDQIMTLIRALGFGISFDGGMYFDGGMSLFGHKGTGGHSLPLTRKDRINEAVSKADDVIPMVRQALGILVTRLVTLGVGEHLRRFDCLADLMKRIGTFRLEPWLEQASMDLLGSQLVIHGLVPLNNHQMEEILDIYLRSKASDATKELVIASLAQKITEQTFQWLSRAEYEKSMLSLGDGPRHSYPEYVGHLLENSNVLALIGRLGGTISHLKSPEAIVQVRHAVRTLGSLLTDIGEDAEVFKKVLLRFWISHSSSTFVSSLKQEQIGKVMISLHQNNPMTDIGQALVEPDCFRKVQQALACAFADAEEPGNLTEGIVAGILQALGHAKLPSEKIEPCLRRLAIRLRQGEMIDNLTDAQLLYVAQGLGAGVKYGILKLTTGIFRYEYVPQIFSGLASDDDEVIRTMTIVVNKLKASPNFAVSDDTEIAQALCGLSRHKQHLSADVSGVMYLLAIRLSQNLSALSDDLVRETINAMSKADYPIPGVASVMCRLVGRWRQLGQVRWNANERWSFFKHGDSQSDGQPPCDVSDEIHSLARCFAQPEVMLQLSPTEVLDLLTLFSTPNCAEEDIQAVIDAMGTRLANEEFIGELTNNELTSALQLLLQPGLGSRGVVAATETLIPRWLVLPDALEAVSTEQALTLLTGIQKSGIGSQNIDLLINAMEKLISKWIALPDTLKGVSPEQVVDLLTGIQESGIRSQNIDLLIRALCQRLVGSGASSPLSIPEIARCTKALQEFGIQSDEVLVAWCGLACWLKEKLNDWQPYSYPASQDPFFQMILHLNELPNKSEIIKLRDDFALHLGSHPELIKPFGFAPIIHIIDSYARLEAPSDTITSTLEKLQKCRKANDQWLTAKIF